MDIKLNFFSPEKLTAEDRLGFSNRNIVEFAFLTDIYPIVVGKDGIKRALICNDYADDILRLVEGRLHGHVLLKDAEVESFDSVDSNESVDVLKATELNVDALVKGTLTLELPDYTDEELSQHDITSLTIIDFIKTPVKLIIHSIDLFEPRGVLVGTFYPENG